VLLPFFNKSEKPLHLQIEPYFAEYVVPAGGGANVTLDDGHPHSIDYHEDGFVVVWNEGLTPAVVEIIEGPSERA